MFKERIRYEECGILHDCKTEVAPYQTNLGSSDREGISGVLAVDSIQDELIQKHDEQDEFDREERRFTASDE